MDNYICYIYQFKYIYIMRKSYSKVEKNAMISWILSNIQDKVLSHKINLSKTILIQRHTLEVYVTSGMLFSASGVCSISGELSFISLGGGGEVSLN